MGLCIQSEKRMKETKVKMMEEISTLHTKICTAWTSSKHTHRDCPWTNLDCKKCRQSKLEVFICRKNGVNHGRAFLRCRTQPLCNAFIWIDDYVKELTPTMELKIDGNPKHDC